MARSTRDVSVQIGPQREREHHGEAFAALWRIEGEGGDSEGAVMLMTARTPDPRGVLDGALRVAQEETLRFDDVIIDLRKREIQRGTRRVHVESKVYNLLVHLALNHDRAVSQWELYQRLWQGRPVSATVLARCVMKARQAVGDNARAQKVIMTISRFGYRFVAFLEST